MRAIIAAIRESWVVVLAPFWFGADLTRDCRLFVVVVVGCWWLLWTSDVGAWRALCVQYDVVKEVLVSGN